MFFFRKTHVECAISESHPPTQKTKLARFTNPPHPLKTDTSSILQIDEECVCGFKIQTSRTEVRRVQNFENTRAIRLFQGSPTSTQNR